MRTTILLLFISILGFSQKPAKLLFQGKEVIIENPPNGRQLYDSIFIDKTEITNMHWLEYLTSVERDSSAQFYKSQLPDTLSFVNKRNSFNPELVVYLLHPTFRDFPVTKISYEQAQNYCKWRTKYVNKILKAKQQKDSKSYEVVAEYRLPTQKEWEFAALGGLDENIYPNGVFEKYKKLNKNDFRIKFDEPMDECKDSLNFIHKKGIDIFEYNANVKEDYFIPENNSVIDCDKNYSVSTSNVYHFPPNKYGLYDMIGNIAEMVQEKGIAKGGSYRSPYDSVNISKDFFYDSPKDWLGFRCVCVIHLKKKKN